ncbi:hypothetical protein [Natronorubrum tibetense]|uniref:hypothetical protein n=1 Tax=Natronorubrum tibetense TaxID=63128 RepID=UPI00187D9595|nr:hypothetical protein [Natronorubrum tibetense]
MNRRTALTLIGTGAATWGAGCLSVEEAGPINFELLNFTYDTHQVETTITDEDENNVLEETYEIKERQDGSRVIREEGFTEATNGDTFNIIVALSDEEPEEGEFRMTCNESNRTEDVFFAEIRETHDGDHTYFEFQQSTCSSGL